MASLQKTLLIPGLEKGHSKSEQQLAVHVKGSRTGSDMTPGGPLSQSHHSCSSTWFCPISQKQTHATKHSWALQVAPNFIHCGEWWLLCKTTGFIKINQWIPCTRLSLSSHQQSGLETLSLQLWYSFGFQQFNYVWTWFSLHYPFWHSLNFLNL